MQRLLRRTLAVAISLVALTAAPARAAGRDFDAYLRLAMRYRAGDHLAAVNELRGWSRADLDRAVRDLRRSPGAEVPLRVVEAAVLLHTDTALLAIAEHNHREAGQEVGFALVVFERAQAAARAAAFDAPRPCIRLGEFYATLAVACLLQGDVDLAVSVAARGLELLPGDAALLYVAGCANETLALVRGHAHLTSEARDARHAAERLLRQATAVDPANAEAKLRLGRVLLDDGRDPEARSLIEPLAAGAADARLRYLASLFLGRLDERRGDWSAAIEDYSRALREQPDSQAARLALAWTLEQRSGPAAGRPSVLVSLGRSGRLGRVDSWWDYPFGPWRRTSEVLERLQREVAKP